MALTPQQARLQAFYSRQDDFFPFRSWPYEIQRIALSTKRNYQERWFFWAFLWYNGAPPFIVQHFCRLGQDSWDQSNESQLRGLMNSPRLPRQMWSMYNNRYENT